ncbi:hypothetical protein ABK040_002176 [Willaertia magna]
MTIASNLDDLTEQEKKIKERIEKYTKQIEKLTTTTITTNQSNNDSTSSPSASASVEQINNEITSSDEDSEDENNLNNNKKNNKNLKNNKKNNLRLNNKKDKQQQFEINYLESQIKKLNLRLKKIQSTISTLRTENIKTTIFSLIFTIIFGLLFLYIGDQLGYFSMNEILLQMMGLKNSENNNENIKELMRKQQEEFEYGMKNY